jgi:hypothetical protein
VKAKRKNKKYKRQKERRRLEMKSGRRRNNRLNKTSWKKMRIMTITKIIMENEGIK